MTNPCQHDVNEGNETFLSKPRGFPSENEQEYLVHEMLSVLRYAESELYYRQLASSVPRSIIFEALSLVNRAVQEGKVRKSRGALFVAIVKRACAERGVIVGALPVGVR